MQAIATADGAGAARAVEAASRPLSIALIDMNMAGASGVEVAESCAS
mgnify:CR=1 FL=1